MPDDKPRVNLSEIFGEAFPIFLSMGMTGEEFWEQDPSLVRAYLKAHKLRFREQNRLAWLQGRYFYDALCAASPIFHDLAKRGTKPAPYHEEPIKFYESEEEARQAEIQRIRDQAAAYFGII